METGTIIALRPDIGYRPGKRRDGVPPPATQWNASVNVSANAHRRADVTGLVLAGGRATRLGGVDKGLVDLAGRPLVAHVLDRLRPQVATVLISANRNPERYGTLADQVVGDGIDGFQGPLAGLAAGLAACRTRWLVMVPCDSPFLPTSLVSRLLAAATTDGAQIATVHDGQRLQPVFSLVGRTLAADLSRYLESGERKIDQWFARHPTAVADFSDGADGFVNVNTPAELAQAAARAARAAGASTDHGAD
jgi:molybdopterin-guanine dinucleotide biosynthesis protein A